MSRSRALPVIFGATSTEVYHPSGSGPGSGSRRPDLTRHSSANPVSAAAHQSAQLEKFRSAISSQSSSSRPQSLRARACSPVPLPATPPISAPNTAWEPHSLTVSTRTFGNAGQSASPGLLPEYPNAATFSGVSGASWSKPPVAISRRPARNAPRVSNSATSAATWPNSSLKGSAKSSVAMVQALIAGALGHDRAVASDARAISEVAR